MRLRNHGEHADVGWQRGHLREQAARDEDRPGWRYARNERRHIAIRDGIVHDDHRFGRADAVAIDVDEMRAFKDAAPRFTAIARRRDQTRDVAQAFLVAAFDALHVPSPASLPLGSL